MAEETGTDWYKWIDGGLKVAIGLAITVAGAFIDNRIKLQTAAVAKQSELFKQAMEKREKNVDLTFKLYDTVSSDRFACYDEGKAPMLKALVDTNNRYNEVQVEYAIIVNGLIKHALSDQNCKAYKDAAAARKRHEGIVPSVTSAHGASQKNGLVKTAGIKTMEEDPGDGWVTLGRHDAREGYLNFILMESESQAEDSLQSGTVIRARHATYLRDNTDDTVLATNPILALVSEDTCVEVKKVVRQLRGSTWARIDILDACPNKPLKQTAELR